MIKGNIVRVYLKGGQGVEVDFDRQAIMSFWSPLYRPKRRIKWLSQRLIRALSKTVHRQNATSDPKRKANTLMAELDFTVKGCTCTVLEPEYWIDENCPIHGEANT